MSPGSLEDVLPLVPGQAGLLYHALADTEGTDVYLVHFRFRVAEPVRVEALRAAVDALVGHHPSLRVCFRHRGLEQPVQLVPRIAEPEWTEIDLSAVEPREAEDGLAKVLDADRGRRFDVTRPPLARSTLVRLPSGRSELILTMHHLIVDGWSAPIIARDLAELYAGRPARPAAPYRGFLAWLGNQPTDAAYAAWRSALAGLAEPTLLVPKAAAHRGVLPTPLEFELPHELSERIRLRARAAGVTVNTVFQAAWGLVLNRMTDSDDVVFGAVTSGRPAQLDGVESMVGLFATTLPTRVRFREGETVHEFLRRLHREQAELIEHHHVSLARVQAQSLGRLFDTIVAFENFPQPAPGHGEREPLELVEVADATHYPVTVSVVANERTWIRLAYRADCVAEPGARRLAASLTRALELLADRPSAPVTGLDVLPDAERARVSRQGTGGRPARTAARATTVPARFAEQVRRTPAASAVESGDRVLTYAELNAASDRLARRLAADGVGRETTVGLLLERSIGLVVAELGVLKAGGCYVPLDPAQPRSRRDTLIRDAGVGLVVTAEYLADAAAVPEPAPTTGPPLPSSSADSAAYVMYTSGSTGEPKGVVVTHRGILSLVDDRRFAGAAHRRVLAHSPHTFDASTYEFWVPLLNGGTVILAGPGPLEPAVLRETVADRRVSALWLTAELLRVVAQLAPDAVAGVRELWAGGDVLSPESVAAIRAACPDLVVVNGYGPTETTTFATCHTVARPPAGDPLPIGEPLDDTEIRLLDRRLRPVPTGSVGEVYIGGGGLARGYLGRPARTAERFVADPTGPAGARLFRTGDLARWTEAGALEFLGRSDDQVKIRGHRVEPGEVEALLEDCPAVVRALVSAEADPSGGKRLVAHIASRGGGIEEVRAYADRHLPAHLRPTAYRAIADVPLTPHGKADRRALAALAKQPPPSQCPDTAASPRSPREHVLCELFAETLGVPRFGPDENFFAAGGHSLLAMRLVAAVEAQSRQRIPIGVLMEAPTPAELAARLESPSDDLGLAPVLKLRAGGDGTPVFLIHPGSALAWRYAGLLPHIEPGRPLYGVQSPAFTRGGPTPEDVGELAELYLGQIRTVQPEGPYLLLGWSFGGLLAYEIAARLRRARQQVGMLVVIDTVPDLGVFERLDARRVEREALSLLAELAAVPPSGAIDRASVYAAVRAGGWASRWSPSRLDLFVELCSGYLRMSADYRPSDFDGAMLLVSATGDAEGVDTRTKVAAWQRAAAEVVVHEIDCRHAEVMDRGPARAIGDIVNRALRDQR